MIERRVSLLVEDLGKLLLKRAEMVTAAESCTGGWIGQAITEWPGSSGWFSASIVTYSNDAKQRLLGVRSQTLRDHGAISAEVAAEMAAGALERGRTEWSLAVTGIAGPGGGSPAKLVGTVWFAWASRNGLREAACRRFDGDRRGVRIRTVEHALEGLLKRVKASA